MSTAQHSNLKSTMHLSQSSPYRGSSDTVQRLWALCHILRDDGITYSEYVTELTYLLFLKMLEEVDGSRGLPKGYKWDNLRLKNGPEQLDFYRKLLSSLGNSRVDPLMSAIFTGAQTRLRKPSNLNSLVKEIDKISWYSPAREDLGDLYEGLLEKNASEKKSGAGQYFTPRPLVDCIIRVLKPRAGEIIQDPAAGTGGFLVSAHRFACLDEKADEAKNKVKVKSICGMELVPDTYRLCLMNLALHGIKADLYLGDTLSPDALQLPEADVVLTNPPFGTKKGGGRPTREDLSLTADSSNKQLAFVEHVVRVLKPGGRAAIVVPDNVLFDENVGRKLRQWMLSSCNLHTILRLPTGIFYAQGVKTNVVFITKGMSTFKGTKKVWVYDARAKMPAFGRNTPLSASDFQDFEAAYGRDPNGLSPRKNGDEKSRFRSFTIDYIIEHGYSLDISWLPDSEDAETTLSDPQDLVAAVLGHLRAATNEIEDLLEFVSDEIVEPEAIDLT